MRMWLAVVVGGAFGSVARYAVNVLLARLFGDPVPWATATVNMVGSLGIGVLAGAIAAQRLAMSAAMRAFVFVGILGGFTTFSSLMLDSLTLVQAGSSGRMLVNLIGQIVVGFLLVYAGFRLGSN